MKKYIWMGGILAGLLMACSPESQKMEGQIDVLPAFDNQTELKVSHLGKNIRYVPLETTDSSLIGSSCKVNLLGDKIMVTYGTRTESHCFLFDAESGKYLREIGHKGEDPRGYSEAKAYVHPVTGNIYFHRAPNKLIKYSQGGEFLGEVEMPNGLPSGIYPLLTKEGMLVYEGEAFNAQHQSQLYYLDEAKGKTGEIALPNVHEASSSAPEGLGDIFSKIFQNIMTNPINAIADGNYLSILFWSVIIGLALKTAANEKTINAIGDLSDAISKVVSWIIQYAPFGILGLVYTSVSESGLEIFTTYGKLLALLVCCMLAVPLVVHPLLIGLTIRKNPFPLIWTCLKESGVSAFFTRSSAANIPVNMELISEPKRYRNL